METSDHKISLRRLPMTAMTTCRGYCTPRQQGHLHVKYDECVINMVSFQKSQRAAEDLKSILNQACCYRDGRSPESPILCKVSKLQMEIRLLTWIVHEPTY